MQQAVRDALDRLHGCDLPGPGEATKAAQRAGIEYAKQSGDRAYIGRKPSVHARAVQQGRNRNKAFYASEAEKSNPRVI